MDAFFGEVKHNKSIVKAHLNLWGPCINDLSEFIINNTSLKDLGLGSDSGEQITLEQSTQISSLFGVARLKMMALSGGCWRDALEG
jgi:hypothetical protein